MEWKKRAEFGLIYAVFTSGILFVMMEIANRNPRWMQMEWPMILINIGTYFILIAAVWVFTGRWGTGAGAFGLIFMILGIVNLYSLEFRQMPISTRDLHNVRTAWNVLEAYEIHLNKRVLLLIALGILLTVGGIWVGRQEKAGKNIKGRNWRCLGLRAAGFLLGTIVFFYVGYFGKNPIKPAVGLGWTWEETYYPYGFLATSVEIARQSLYKIEKPSGYAEENLEVYRAELVGKEGVQTPDVILILNESWYDLSLIMDLEASEEVSPFIDSLENCIRGYAVVPGVGGGTNSSEYELLTGNSLQIMQGITPFNSLNMDEEATVVTVLKGQNYETTAFHPAPGLNYRRSIAYPAMGFDHIYFEDDVEGLEYWEQRTSFATDNSDFSIVRELYEANLKESSRPQFLYNLTIQNHGGYALVSADKVPLQVTEGAEELDEWSVFELNEYLSCVNMTDQAFKDLVAYYEKVERPVLICMVGDHCPTIATKLINKELTEEEKMLYLHSTPFLIWSNRELEEENLGFISMPYLMPKLLDTAGVGLPPYYYFITDSLMPEVPVLTSTGVYLDQNGVPYSYKEETRYTELLEKYFTLEY